MIDDDFTECEYSGLAKAFCSHCQGHTLGDEVTGTGLNVESLFDDSEIQPDNDDIEFEIVRVFDALYHGVCTIERGHKIRRGERVAIVQRADNPMLTVKGVACKACVSILPHA